jgi:class 3 adenylate cyclase
MEKRCGQSLRFGDVEITHTRHFHPAERFELAAPGIAVAEPILRRPGRGALAQITALCCKLVKAMRFAVDVDPEDLSEIIRNFQDATVVAVTGMGGTIATTTPHKIQAFFGWPEAHEDDAERAVTAGLDAVARVGQLSSPKGEPLQAQVVVATGLALASQRPAVGEPSAIAAGMCDLASPNSVLVTASTRRLISSAFVCENPEQHALPGVSEPVSTWRVRGKRAGASRLKAS